MIKKVWLIMLFVLMIILGGCGMKSSFGGCYGKFVPIISGQKPVIVDSQGQICMFIEPESCLGRVILSNDCEDSFDVYTLKDCEINKNSNFAYSEKYYSEVESFFHDGFIKLPPKWVLTFYPPSNEKITLYYSYNNTGVEIFCKSDLIKLDNFSLRLQRDSENYTLAGVYVTKGRNY